MECLHPAGPLGSTIGDLVLILCEPQRSATLMAVCPALEGDMVSRFSAAADADSTSSRPDLSVRRTSI